MKRPILALVTDAFGGRGGIAQYNRNFLTALATAGHHVIVLTRHAQDTEILPGGIEQRPAQLGRIAYSYSALVEALRLKPDIIFCGHLYMAPLGAIAAVLLGARLIVQTHGIEAWPRPSRLGRWGCERAALILSVSRYTRAKVLDWASVAPERVIVLPNTVGDCYTPGDGSSLRRKWQLDGKKVLLTVGRMHAAEQYKGHDRVIEALPSLIATTHDVVYVVAGEGNDRSRLEQLVQRMGISRHVRFVGAISRETLIEAYRMSDLFVLPSTGEGFGIAFLEAMACGTPAIGLDVAGARDALADGELGISVHQVYLRDAIATALADTKPDPATLHDAVRARFGYASFRTRITTVFTELLKTA